MRHSSQERRAWLEQNRSRLQDEVGRLRAERKQNNIIGTAASWPRSSAEWTQWLEVNSEALVPTTACNNEHLLARIVSKTFQK